LISRVFVVDDEPNIASTISLILQANGYDARWFQNPLEALTAARLVGPDLLISDVMMPELSGIDLAILLKEQHPRCKVLLFSGHALSSDIVRKVGDHGNHFELLEKPIHPTDLLAWIKDADDGFEKT
jgi:DNA-binding NtrC family response regulator